MKTIIALVVTLAATGTAFAQYRAPSSSSFGYGSTYNSYGTGSNPNSHTTSPYMTNQGTYVQPHSQTNPNNTQMDNYGSRGNFNPNTGSYGTRSPRY